MSLCLRMLACDCGTDLRKIRDGYVADICDSYATGVLRGVWGMRWVSLGMRRVCVGFAMGMLWVLWATHGYAMAMLRVCSRSGTGLLCVCHGYPTGMTPLVGMGPLRVRHGSAYGSDMRLQWVRDACAGEWVHCKCVIRMLLDPLVCIGSTADPPKLRH